MAALSQFIFRSTDKCLLFFQALKGKGKISWDDKCEEAFEGLKAYPTSLPLLSKPLPGEVLYVYLAVSKKAVSFVLIQEEDKVQAPVYYSSKAFQRAEERYTPLEKLALALVLSALKLRPYFQGHPIRILTSYPLHQVLQNLELSR